MSETKVLTLFGKKKSGKDTIANYIAGELFVKDVKIYHFADDIKHFCVDYFYLDPKLLWGTDEDKETLTWLEWEKQPFYGDMVLEYTKINFITAGYRDRIPERVLPTGFMSYRQVLERVGTDMFRKIDSEYWIKRLRKKIERENPEIAIIADGRFDNEKIGVSWKLTREGGKPSSHASNKGDSVITDEVIDNKDKSLEDTFKDVDALIEKYWDWFTK